MKTKKTFFAAVTLMAAFCFTAVQTAHAQCRDPWINNAYRELAGRAPTGRGEVGECNIKLYNNGSWNNYDELKRYVQEVRSNLKIGVKDLANGKWGMAVQGNGATAVNVFDLAGNMVAAGGGNLIGNDSGGLVAAGGGNLVGNDGASIKIDRNTPGFSFSGGYSALSGIKIKTSGRGGISVR